MKDQDNMHYGRLSTDLILQLTRIVGRPNISTQEDDLLNYSRDEAVFAQRSMPDVILKPVSTKMISQIMSLAYEHSIPVTPRGGGTGISGGCIPVYGGILLSLEKMSRIIKINTKNFTATVEPGVTLDQLNEELIQHGLYYPIHIGQMTATLGGNVATNAGGMNAVKYGVTRHQVIGIESVLSNGQVINSGGEFVKSSTGYDLTQLITGSEGTLAIVTRIILRIMPRPACREMLLVPFTSLEKAIDIVPQLLRLKTIPMGIEFIERDVIQAVEKQLEYELPNHNEEAFLMIIMEGDSSEEIIQYFAELENICRQNGAVEFYAPDGERAKRKLVEFREKMSPSLAKLGPWELVDAVVPRSEIANYIRKVKGIAKDFNTTIFAFGHAGDGNVHLHPTCIDQDEEQWRSMVPAIMQRLYEECTALGGTISGEHGIGSEKKRYLSLALSAETIALMKNIKAAFDPKNILNPGKIIDY